MENKVTIERKISKFTNDIKVLIHPYKSIKNLRADHAKYVEHQRYKKANQIHTKNKIFVG